jgi:hypothetical protein
MGLVQGTSFSCRFYDVTSKLVFDPRDVLGCSMSNRIFCGRLVAAELHLLMEQRWRKED